jgi:endonuclease G
MPALSERVRATAYGYGAPIDHRRYSLIFNQERGLAVVTAHNIDGGAMLDEGAIPRRDRFRLDPSLPRELQIDDDRGYRSNPWDRGHLVRRRSLHWGDRDEAAAADSESFYWSNITPQHTALHHTAWGRIEDWILGVAEADAQRACVFTGPVLTEDDPQVVNRDNEKAMRIPAGFWKVVALPHDGALRVAAFLVWQRDFDRAEPVTFDPLLEQVRLTTIEFLTGLSFAALQDSDPMRPSDGPLAFADDAPRSRPMQILGPRDIVL